MKKFLLMFAIAGVFTACNNEAEVTTTEDTTTINAPLTPDTTNLGTDTTNIATDTIRN